MLLDHNSELQLRATRPKPLVMSILVHVVLIGILVINPGWFDTTHRRVVRIAGEDFDLSKLELRQLTLPPRMPPRAMPVPPPAAQPPLVQQLPQQAAPPPPPPPPPPPAAEPPPPPPDRVIRPDDVLAEGARPDGGTPRASRGDTREQARAGGSSANQGPSSDSQEAQQAKEAQRGQDGRQAQIASNAPNKVLPNLNPAALRSPPSLLSAGGKIVEANLASAPRNGGRTGLARADNNGTYSTSDPQILSPNPKGVDFGPYLNRLIDRLRENWYSVMPEIARLGQQGRVDIVFSVSRSGNVKELKVVANSGHDALDKGAVSAIQLSNPFASLPPEYETDLKLRIAFLYNMHP